MDGEAGRGVTYHRILLPRKRKGGRGGEGLSEGDGVSGTSILGCEGEPPQGIFLRYLRPSC